jgi:hypothetical protein
MIIYEVNLKIDAAIFEDYMHWLEPHMKAILKLPGFIKAVILEEQNIETTDACYVSIQYYVNNMDGLNSYLSDHAKTMREDGLNKFPNQFSATRRIFNIQNTLFLN